MKALAVGLPPERYRTVTWRDGTNAALSSRFACPRVRPAHQTHQATAVRPEEWLLIEWPEGDEEPGGYYVEEIMQGQTVKDVLASIQYSDFELAKMVKNAIDGQVKAGALKPREGVDLLNAYEAVMQEYTYIDHNGKHSPANAVAPAVEASLAVRS